jgi:hypothetical protein
MGIKIFNNLPLEIKNAAGNQKCLKLLQKNVYSYSYSSFTCLGRWNR